MEEDTKTSGRMSREGREERRRRARKKKKKKAKRPHRASRRHRPRRRPPRRAQVSVEQMAALMGCTVEEARSSVEVLDEAGLFDEVGVTLVGRST